MPTTLALQDYGTLGSGVVRQAADQTGNTIPNAPGAVLAVRNIGATPRTLTLAAVGKCNASRLHDLPITVPDDGVVYWIPLGIDEDRQRFGAAVQVSYEAGGAADLEVAAAEMTSHRGVGEDLETPPALGATPVAIPVFAQSDTIEDTDQVAAVADGATMPNDGETQVWIENEGAAPRTASILARLACSHGFLDDEQKVIPAGALWQSPALPKNRFGSVAHVTFDAPTSIKLLGVRQERFTS